MKEFECAERSWIDNDASVPAPVPKPGILPLLRVVLESRSADAVFINCAPYETILLSAMLSALPFNRCALVASDLVLNKPYGIRGALVSALKRLALARVDKFLLPQRDIDGYRTHYGIDDERVTYVPWKVNGPEILREIETEESDYIFSGGVTNRDWPTLAAALAGLSIPLIASIPHDSELGKRGQGTTVPRASDFSSPITIIRHGDDPREWLTLAARSKFCVLPIRADSLNASGISTYLSIMALKKTVIISEGPSTRGILDGEKALVVPPGDPGALREAILRADSDPELRRRMARAGFEHAQASGDAVRLHRDFIRGILEAISAPRPGTLARLKRAIRPYTPLSNRAPAFRP